MKAAAFVIPGTVWMALLSGCSTHVTEAEQDASSSSADTPAGRDDDASEPDLDSGAREAADGDGSTVREAGARDVSTGMQTLADASLHDAMSEDATARRDAAVDAGSAEAAAADLAYDAFNKVFYSVRAGKGYFLNNAGAATADAWWTEAELIEMAIDAYDRKPSDAHKQQMTELIAGFVSVQGTDWTYNDFNDDIAWMVIASVRAHLRTGNADFLSYAKKNWDAMYARAASSDYGGGLWWKVGVDSKNACINGPGAIGAYLLYTATKDASYLEKAKAIYAWERKALFDAKTGAVYDNINPMGGDKWTFTYNSGTFIGIANYLYQETHEAAYLDDAKLAAAFVKAHLSDADGLIKENDISGDGAAFKAIMFRWLTKLVADNGLQADYLPWLQTNRNRAWANRRAGDAISWNNWKEATPHRLLDASGAMATVQILQVVPAGGPEVAWYNSAAQNGRANIEAEHCDEKRGMNVEASEGGGEQLGGVSNDAWARYGQVDFGASAPTMIDARASVANGAGGQIEIHIDRANGPLIDSIALVSTGGWTNYESFSATLSPVSGIHDVYLVFKASAGGGYVANLNWFKLR